MTNEEAIEILDAAGKRRNKPELFDALDMGIAALKNQERMQRELKSLDGIAETCDKLEKALEMACDRIEVSTDCTEECTREDEDCIKCWVEYYKSEAGIDNKKQMPERELSASK